MQRDVAAIIQSTNLFVYTGNNPINRIDPDGLFWRDWLDIFLGWFDGIGNRALEAGGMESQQFFEPNNPDLFNMSSALGHQTFDFWITHNIVVDLSVSVGIGDFMHVTVGYTHFFGNVSGYRAGYVHVGGGVGYGIGLMPVDLSFSVGVVPNSANPNSFTGNVHDMGIALGLGAGGTVWPSGVEMVGFSVGTSVGAGYQLSHYILVHSRETGRTDLYRRYWEPDPNWSNWF